MAKTRLQKRSIDQIKHRFAKSFLDMLVLKMLSETPSWGYKIMDGLNKGYDIKIGPSSIYPLLSSLESQGFVTNRMELYGRRKKKTYMITDEGNKLLEDYIQFLRDQIL